MPFREVVVEGYWGDRIVEIHICKHCGAEAFDLPNNLDVEWWSDEECGCHR